MGIEYLDKTHAKLVVSYGSGKRRVRRVKRITYKGKKDAERQYMEFKQSLTDKVDSEMSVEDLLNLYIDSFERNGGKQTTVRVYRVSAKPIISFFKRFNAKDVSLYDVDTFVSAEVKYRASKTIRNEVSLLKSAYTNGTKAQKRGKRPSVCRVYVREENESSALSDRLLCSL